MEKDQYKTQDTPVKGKQGVDKDPAEEKEKQKEKVTTNDLKGKKVDADPSKPSDQPTEQGNG